jgi:hypothetical protein
MACNDCKKKNKTTPKQTITINKMENFIKIFLIIWSLFAIYGLISLFNLIF